jgi:hypothetical protein
MPLLAGGGGRSRVRGPGAPPWPGGGDLNLTGVGDGGGDKVGLYMWMAIRGLLVGWVGWSHQACPLA